MHYLGFIMNFYYHQFTFPYECPRSSQIYGILFECSLSFVGILKLYSTLTNRRNSSPKGAGRAQGRVLLVLFIEGV